MDWGWKAGDVAIVIATLLGPILAVQAQKWIERSRERHQRRVTVFRVLMTTRAAQLSPAHVEALNIVPIEFYGKRASFKRVVDAWKEYIDYLYRDKEEDPRRWAERRSELLKIMLTKMGTALGYKFNSVEISRELYLPRRHAAIESDQEIIRKGLARIFSGEMAFPMDVKAFPTDLDALQSQASLQTQLSRWLSGEIVVKIELSEPKSPQAKSPT
ncbi:MAG TPA: DUF6680 family protein [Stellaceae bacterium]|jgi:hypothetical protein|nr:DUF6680 family protein [Stellaceae bacterium]